MRRVVASGVAVAVGVGHTAGEGGGSFAIGAGGSVTPASVTARVFSHLRAHAHSRERRVMIRVESVLLDLLPSLLLVVLASLAFPPQDDTGQD